MADTDVVSREPYKSGNSKVLTVSGVPAIPSDKRVYLKRVSIKGIEATLIVSYDEMSEYDVEQMPSQLEPVFD